MPRLSIPTCQRIREEIRKWDDYFRLNREQYHEVTSFVMGEQWEPDESNVFETYKKIPLTFNKLAPLINHLLGEQQQNTPALQVYPEDHVPVETAEIRSALVKDISLNSDAKLVYQRAFQQAAIGGFGAYRIGTRYVNEFTFDQELYVEGFKDPTRCFWDVSAEDVCKVEGMCSGYRTRVSRKKFRALYGRAIESMIGSSSANDDTTEGFWDDDSITVIDYYRRKYDRVKIYQLNNGMTVEQKELDMLEKIEVDGMEMLMMNGYPVAIVQQRTTHRFKVKHYKIAGDYVLESTDFPTESLPIPFVDQNSYFDKHGKQVCRPIVKDAKDAQRFINYLGTQIAYLIKISRYDQFLVSKANVRSNDTEQIWSDPGVVQGGLIYDESPNGNKPEQLRPPEIPQSLLVHYERAERDIHTITGMFDTQLGDQGNEVSGKAIDARSKRGSYSNYVIFNALNRAVAVGGEIINEAIPKVYDAERQIKLYMPDTGMQNVTLNEQQDDYGIIVNNDMRGGSYKIRLQPGPSYEGQKTEGLEALQLVIRNDPQLFSLFADLYAENLPLANNLEIRNRLRTIVPPEVIEAGKTGKPLPPKPEQPSPEQMQLQLKEKELQAKMQETQMLALQKEREIMMKQKELQAKMREMDQKAMADYERLENERLLAAAEVQEQVLRYQAELQRTEADMNISHAQNLVKLLTSHPKEHKGI